MSYITVDGLNMFPEQSADASNHKPFIFYIITKLIDMNFQNVCRLGVCPGRDDAVSAYHAGISCSPSSG